jgi:hypothetical protein
MEAMTLTSGSYDAVSDFKPRLVLIMALKFIEKEDSHSPCFLD